MIQTKTTILLFLLVLLVLGLIAIYWTIKNAGFSKDWQDNDWAKISIGQGEITAELAVSWSKKSIGLSGKGSLADNQGMLFIFNQPTTPSFWMKDMKFNLDFVWINGDKIVDLSKNVPAPLSDQSPVVISPKESADKVLEINAGTADKLNIQVGDKINIKKITPNL
ncbi:MAG: hypothetical protein UV58_C0006G0004 [Candidatus Wolfebacteria bacterium GW2011_GWC1_43_10]|uniref:DUF192 domain-containing protein n=2 Tax=Candidatus Wolfeibacteriota TaxID=1752735 RepID=A0A0G1CAL9_9BACT|nr:MAG: hypothetical protein UV58_C0006G0004 [Candidatus Wolfebacteria bacterium GW2011_GWC1_43_10]KKT22910.1 MAG: hypothetical protein UW08_C0002G0039 [Parcubacteria group bacterium GW2011_GWB1_43_8b]OGM89059.1 MAG: hypothetical protein A2108_02865 [Candidatus Wolfebacteria bacterium GWA1_42_9]